MKCNFFIRLQHEKLRYESEYAVKLRRSLLCCWTVQVQLWKKKGFRGRKHVGRQQASVDLIKLSVTTRCLARLCRVLASRDAFPSSSSSTNNKDADVDADAPVLLDCLCKLTTVAFVESDMHNLDPLWWNQRSWEVSRPLVLVRIHSRINSISKKHPKTPTFLCPTSQKLPPADTVARRQTRPCHIPENILPSITVSLWENSA